jgi:hypothetical protein
VDRGDGPCLSAGSGNFHSHVPEHIRAFPGDGHLIRRRKRQLPRYYCPSIKCWAGCRIIRQSAQKRLGSTPRTTKYFSMTRVGAFSAGHLRLYKARILANQAARAENWKPSVTAIRHLSLGMTQETDSLVSLRVSDLRSIYFFKSEARPEFASASGYGFKGKDGRTR